MLVGTLGRGHGAGVSLIMQETIAIGGYRLRRRGVVRKEACVPARATRSRSAGGLGSQHVMSVGATVPAPTFFLCRQRRDPPQTHGLMIHGGMEKRTMSSALAISGSSPLVTQGT